MSYFNELVNKTKGNVFMIAEACDNHMGSYEMAKALARGAKKAGCDAVKFQHHLPSEEMLRDAKMSDNFDEHLFDFLIQNALSIDDHNNLKNFCDEIGILYLCTPFSLPAAKEILDLVPFFKIGSGEFQDLWFIDNLKKFNKPLLLSTGMCSWDEIIESKNSLKDVEYALMNCLSEYPVNIQDLNLGVIKKMIEEFPGTIIGHSDHSQTNFTSVIAVSYGAKIIEKHITLSTLISGPDKDVSISIEQMQDLVFECKSVNKVTNNKKILNNLEKDIRDWAYRSVISNQNIEKDQVITEEMICSKRPVGGIPSKDYKKVIGLRAIKNIKKNNFINWEDLE